MTKGRRFSIAAMTRHRSWFGIVAVTAAIGTMAMGQDGFTPLFNGRSLDGWQTIPLGKSPGRWFVREGVLSFEGGDSWIATKEKFSDFVLQLEYRAGGDDSDSGIFLRSTSEGYPSFTGMELEIRGRDASPEPGVRSTGALYGAVAPLKVASKPPGEWNSVEVSVIGRKLQATWNGERIHDIDLDDRRYDKALRGPLNDRARSGHVGMQAHLTGQPVEFRNVRIKKLK